ncbi:hypothetical protein EBS80_04030, partial [bacterium]|nr:hypothetical protein [bacterium]
NGNGPWEMREALRRLAAKHIKVHEPSDELVAFLNIADGRGGLRNAMHRFDAGRLTRNWTAATSNPAEDHYAGRDIFAKPR